MPVGFAAFLSFDVIPDGAPFLFDVIPAGAQRRAGIQTGATQVHAPPTRTTREAKLLDPGFHLRRPRDDIKKQNVIPDGLPRPFMPESA